MTESLNPNRPDRAPWNLAGMAIVGIAAAVLSFDTWVRLAEAVGFTATTSPFGITIRIAWLLPLAVDVYALTSTRIWIHGHPEPRVVRYAARNAIGAITLSVAGNALYHAFLAANWTIRDCPPVVIAIGGVPPLLLGLVVHLHTLVNQQAKPTIQTTETPTRISPAAHTLNPTPTTESQPAPATRTETTPTRTTTPTPTRTIRPPKPASASISQIATDDELIPTAEPAITNLIQNHGGTLPGEHKIRAALAEVGIAVGPKRAKRIAERVIANNTPPTEPGTDTADEQTESSDDDQERIA